MIEQIMTLIENRIAPMLERIALALETRFVEGSAGVSPEVERNRAITAIRHALREGDAIRALTALDELSILDPEAPEREKLAEEVERSRVEAVAGRREMLDAARSAGDAERVLNYRDELKSLGIDRVQAEALDRELGQWVMLLLMKKLRAGSVPPEVASLAQRVSEVFAHRPEGASMRAALPTLRRSAGLCARCARPYVGEEDACPQCLSSPPTASELPITPFPGA